MTLGIFQVWKYEIPLSGKSRHCVGGMQALKNNAEELGKDATEYVCTWTSVNYTPERKYIISAAVYHITRMVTIPTNWWRN